VAFARLFARNPAERVLSFLDETSTIGDDLRIMASLPPGPFLRALALHPLQGTRCGGTFRTGPGGSAMSTWRDP
jgi:hypothetical protein